MTSPIHVCYAKRFCLKGLGRRHDLSQEPIKLKANFIDIQQCLTP